MTDSTAKLLAGTVLTIAGVVAYVVLAVNNTDVQGLTIFLTPVIAALLVSGTVGTKVEAVQDSANVAADAAQEAVRQAKQAVLQTNGVMDDRIKDGVTVVLKEAGLHPATRPQNQRSTDSKEA